MAGSEDIRQVIVGRIQSQFPGLMPSVAVHFENQAFTQPQNAPWVYVTVIDTLTGREALGAPRRFKAMGVVTCQIAVPENSGTRVLKQVGDALQTILIDRQVQIPGGGQLTFSNVKRSTRGPVNGWYSGNLMCEWHAHITI